MDIRNRYLVFYGNRYYPYGGWEDYKGEFETLEDAKNFIYTLDTCYTWAHIVFEKKIIYSVTSVEEYHDTKWEVDEVNDER